MVDYLGEEIVDISNTEFKDYSVMDWILFFIERYGGIDGSHHKDWVLDQIARLVMGTKPIVKATSHLNGCKELYVTLGEPTDEYLKWAEEMTDGGEYEYNFGIAP